MWTHEPVWDLKLVRSEKETQDFLRENWENFNTEYQTANITVNINCSFLSGTNDIVVMCPGV